MVLLVFRINKPTFFKLKNNLTQNQNTGPCFSKSKSAIVLRHLESEYRFNIELGSGKVKFQSSKQNNISLVIQLNVLQCI